MAIIASQGIYSHLSDLIKKLDAPESPELFKDVVTVNTAAITTLVLGTVLGKITASGKYIPSVATANDGSQNAVAIYIGRGDSGAVQPTTTVAATDTKVLALTRGKAMVSKNALVLDASYNTQPLRDAAYLSLQNVGIFAQTTI